MTTRRELKEALEGEKKQEQAPIIGDNSFPNSEEIEGFLLRLERIQEEKDGLADDFNAVLAEAEEEYGFDKKTLRLCLKIRKNRMEFENGLARVAQYMAATGQQLMLDLGPVLIGRSGE